AIAAVRERTSSAGTDTSAQNAAKNFFHANFPNGYLGVNPPDPTVNLQTVNGAWVATVTASATSPTYFAKVLGFNSFNVGAHSEATKPALDMMLVLDCTGSLAPPYSPSTTFPRLKAAAIYFINQFQSASGGDRIGLVTFSNGVGNFSEGFIPIDKTSTRGFDRTAMTNAINNLSASGWTASAEAMRRAFAELNAIPTSLRSAHRVIVFFSDGAPNTIAGNFSAFSGAPNGDLPSGLSTRGFPNSFYSSLSRDNSLGAHSVSSLPQTMDYSYTGSYIDPKTSQSTPRYEALTQTISLQSYDNKRSLSTSIANNACNVNKAARNMLENIANTARSGSGNDAVTVMTLGLGSELYSLELDCPDYGADTPGNTEYGANILRRLANTKDPDPNYPSRYSVPVDTYNSSQPTGLFCWARTDNDLTPCFNAIANAILRLSK
ncbi:MAG TPA: vWA domain-containing protein, partial [Geobacteraceae bacterium]|nr:vWA domain-containing protein [Geobacteraceae bacterium]